MGRKNRGSAKEAEILEYLQTDDASGRTNQGEIGKVEEKEARVKGRGFQHQKNTHGLRTPSREKCEKGLRKKLLGLNNIRRDAN